MSSFDGTMNIIGANVGWLFAGRLIVGLGSGTALSADTAWVKELSSRSDHKGPAGAPAVGFANSPPLADALEPWDPLPAMLSHCRN